MWQQRIGRLAELRYIVLQLVGMLKYDTICLDITNDVQTITVLLQRVVIAAVSPVDRQGATPTALASTAGHQQVVQQMQHVLASVGASIESALQPPPSRRQRATKISSDTQMR